jgi:uncharacterized RDD family membrane protein YckC
MADKNNSKQNDSKQSNCDKSATKTSVTRAPFWKKLAAWIYDLLGATAVFILALCVGYLIIYLVSLLFSDGKELGYQLNKNPLWVLYLITCVQYYYVWCWVKGGQTVGMRAWRLKLCHANGELLSWKTAYLRSLYSLAGLAHLSSLLNKKKQGWHDQLVNSYVVVIPKTKT